MNINIATKEELDEVKKEVVDLKKIVIELSQSPNVVSLTGAMEILSCSKETFKKYRDSGQIKATEKIGHPLFYKKDVLSLPHKRKEQRK